MACSSTDFIGIVSAQKVDRGKSPSCCVRADKFPFRYEVDFNVAVNFCLALYFLREAYNLQQFLDAFVEVGNITFIRSFIVVLFKDGVCCLDVYAHSVKIDFCSGACLLLENRENIMAETRLVNPYHIRMALAEIARKHEHISYPLQSSFVLRAKAQL